MIPRQSTLLVIVCPYTDASQSGVVLTAYAFGKPVVATRVGGLPEYVEDGVTGLLVPPRNPQALAEALVRLLRDPDTQRTLSQGIRHNEALSWESIIKRTISVYEQVLSGV